MPTNDVEKAVVPLRPRGAGPRVVRDRPDATTTLTGPPDAAWELIERELRIDPRGELDRVGIEALEALLNAMGEGEALVLRLSLADDVPVRLGLSIADDADGNGASERRQGLEQALDLATGLLSAGKRP